MGNMMNRHFDKNSINDSTGGDTKRPSGFKRFGKGFVSGAKHAAVFFMHPLRETSNATVAVAGFMLKKRIINPASLYSEPGISTCLDRAILDAEKGQTEDGTRAFQNRNWTEQTISDAYQKIDPANGAADLPAALAQLDELRSMSTKRLIVNELPKNLIPIGIMKLFGMTPSLKRQAVFEAALSERLDKPLNRMSGIIDEVGKFSVKVISNLSYIIGAVFAIATATFYAAPYIEKAVRSIQNLF